MGGSVGAGCPRQHRPLHSGTLSRAGLQGDDESHSAHGPACVVSLCKFAFASKYPVMIFFWARSLDKIIVIGFFKVRKCESTMLNVTVMQQ